VLDRRIDAYMARTRGRPLPTGTLNRTARRSVRDRARHRLDAGAGAARQHADRGAHVRSLIGYAVLYTVWLKRATPQNIVIGGAAGAAPPVLGWAAVTNTIDPHALLLFLIIFAWTPPHFWALAIARRHDYAKAGIPMLPVTHGVEFTRLHVLLYTVMLCARHAAALCDRHERPDLPAGRGAGAERALPGARGAAEAHAARRPADAGVPLLDHLPDVAVPGAAGRSLPAHGNTTTASPACSRTRSTGFRARPRMRSACSATSRWGSSAHRPGTLARS
jgi:hypothetical protein